MSFEVRTEFGNLDPEAKRALVAMQHAIKGHLDDQDKRNRRPKRPVTELVEEGSVLAKPGQVVRVQPSDTDIQVVLPPSDPGNGGEDIIVSVEGDGTATGKVLVTPASGTCANPGTTTLNTPGSYRFTSTGAPSEGELAETSNWSGPAPLSLDDLPEVGAGKVLGNNTGSPATPVELSGSQVLDLVGSTRGSVLERGAAGWTAVTPGAIELPIVSKGAGADPVYQQLATAGIADDAVTNAKLANMAQSTVKLRAAAAGTGDPTDGTATQVLDMIGSTRGSLLERGASSWGAIVPGTSGLPLVSAGAGADPAYTALASTAFAAVAAKSVLVNATNASAVPAFLAGTAAFQYLRVNSANNALEWATLSTHASTSILYSSDTWQRAALTGDVTASQNSNATTIANDAVTNAKAANMAANTIKANPTASTADPQDLAISADSLPARVGGNLVSHPFATLAGKSLDYAAGVVDYVGSTSNINLSSLTGAQGVVDISTLECGGSVTIQSVSADYSFAGFTAKTDGYWFWLIDRRSSGSTVGTLLEDSGSTSTSIRNPKIADFAFAAGAKAMLYYYNTRWRVLPTPDVIAATANTFTAANTFSGTVALGAQVEFTGTISPTALSADQNNYSPTGWATANIVRLSTNSGTTRTLTGAAAGASGELKWIVNTGSGVIQLDAASTSSTAANRFLHVSGTTFSIAVNGVCGILYDGTSSRWRPIYPNLII